MTSLTERNSITRLIEECTDAGARQSHACSTIGLSARTLQRWRNDAQQETAQGDRRPMRIQTPGNALSPVECERILKLVNSPEFAHLPPTQIVPILADQGRYLASESSLYRILRKARQLTHRGSGRSAQKRGKPRALCATAPNQIFSWDITYLPTRIKGVHYYLYLFMDIFSRKIVGWQVYESESAEQASQVMIDICHRENIGAHQVVLHSDNGSPMKGATMLATLQTLGVMPSFSRPAVSNDNPYSEALFRTCKYRPDYPQNAFENLMAARTWVGTFVHWYNHGHRHSAIRFVTPAQRHDGEDKALLDKRNAVYQAAKELHPLRWSGNTRNWQRVELVHLNPNQTKVDREAPPQTKQAA
jgi:transposase InsO family protein